ncbi:hypothetical protein LC612_37870 [Nostoc sp. CHAB 5834]|nr:hypothetical protein [Nostoc sp. CHAB 5834]
MDRIVLLQILSRMVQERDKTEKRFAQLNEDIASIQLLLDQLEPNPTNSLEFLQLAAQPIPENLAPSIQRFSSATSDKAIRDPLIEKERQFERFLSNVELSTEWLERDVYTLTLNAALKHTEVKGEPLRAGMAPHRTKSIVRAYLRGELPGYKQLLAEAKKQGGANAKNFIEIVNKKADFILMEKFDWVYTKDPYPLEPQQLSKIDKSCAAYHGSLEAKKTDSDGAPIDREDPSVSVFGRLEELSREFKE